ncbi:flavodoxin reductase [Mucilaginibacter mali]|uniref:Flavodoxin reductase n=1 Tax=Mucilaginibacter mali TaxID=2740462 RepID=A0A7D4TTN5_9SPHI|nr:FAD-binding oxidoreductase [Mucilaginibacter mali]QKJ29215.1 flavodoxin reductase [Mucilaginibacter mali]
MDKYIVKVLAVDTLTHNVKRFLVEKPAGYNFIPGQATDVAINLPSLEGELRPFTFTSMVDDDHLEFIIKIYTGHNGITEKLGSVKPGDELIVHEVFGAINYRGPGVFIAGGAGITPFIAILRQLKKEDGLAGNTLLFANRTAGDIILEAELNELLGNDCKHVLEQARNKSLPGSWVDRNLLEAHISPDAFYYICGPDAFTQAVIDNLGSLGVAEDKIVIEQ